MKKYLAAAAVAVMVFAFAAFAASLNVTAPTLQAGQTAEGELECTENAEIVAWFFNDHLVPATVSGAVIELDEDHTCEGDRLYLTLLDDEDGVLVAAASADGQGVPIGSGSSVTIGIPDHTFLGDASLPGGIPASDVYGVQIGIDQGF